MEGRGRGRRVVKGNSREEDESLCCYILVVVNCDQHCDTKLRLKVERSNINKHHLANVTPIPL